MLHGACPKLAIGLYSFGHDEFDPRKEYDAQASRQAASLPSRNVVRRLREQG